MSKIINPDPTYSLFESTTPVRYDIVNLRFNQILNAILELNSHHDSNLAHDGNLTIQGNSVINGKIVLKDLDVSPITDIILKDIDGTLEIKDINDSVFKKLSVNCLPLTPGGANGLATLDSNSRLAQPANTVWDGTAERYASSTPSANKIVVSSSTGKIDNGWIDVSITPSANKIPISNPDGMLDPYWVFSISWIGEPVSIGSALYILSTTYPSLTAFSKKSVAMADNGTSSIRFFTITSDNIWSSVGNTYTLSMGKPDITALELTSPYSIAHIDQNNNLLRKFSFDGVNWAQVGNALSISGSVPAITALSNTDIAFINGADSKLYTFRFSASNWVQVGSPISIPNLGQCSVTTLNSTDIAIMNTGDGSLSTYRFSGSNWSLVGTPLAVANLNTPDITSLNNSDILMTDAPDRRFLIYRFNGSTWSVCNQYTSTATSCTAPTIAALNGTDIAFYDTYSHYLKMFRFPFSILKPYRV